MTKLCLLIALAACTCERPPHRPAERPPQADEAPPVTAPEARARGPVTNAELTAPDEDPVLGLALEVVDRVREPLAAPHAGTTVADGEGVLISPRIHAPLAWEAAHGTTDGFEMPRMFPSALIDSVMLRATYEALVFEGGTLTRIETLRPCDTQPCTLVTAPAGGAIVLMPAGFVAEHGVETGWTIAIEP